MSKIELEELERVAEGIANDRGIYILREKNKRGLIWKFYDVVTGNVPGFWSPDSEWGSFGQVAGNGETMELGTALEKAVARMKELTPQ